MEQNMTMSAFMKKAYSGELRKRLVPMELAAGWPSVSIRNKRLCVTVPYFRMRLGEGNQVALYPIPCVMTLLWPRGEMIEFTALPFQKEYKGIDFGKPVGFMRDAARQTPKAEYEAKREALYSCYDELIACILEHKSFEREGEMRELFSFLMEPALYPMYRKISKNFFDAYCGLE